MSIEKEIEAFTDEVIKSIQNQASLKNVDKIQQLTNILSQAQYLAATIKDVEKRLVSLKDAYKMSAQEKKFLIKESLPLEQLIFETSKAKARANASAKRAEFLNSLTKQGLLLKPYKGVVYQNPNTVGLVGIAFSSDNGNTWFLGLPDYNYETVVLLCENTDDDVIPFIIPQEQYVSITNSLSRSKGQVKFNIRYSNGKYLLNTKSGDYLLNSYIDNISSFKK